MKKKFSGDHRVAVGAFNAYTFNSLEVYLRFFQMRIIKSYRRSSGRHCAVTTCLGEYIPRGEIYEHTVKTMAKRFAVEDLSKTEIVVIALISWGRILTSLVMLWWMWSLLLASWTMGFSTCKVQIFF